MDSRILFCHATSTVGGSHIEPFLRHIVHVGENFNAFLRHKKIACPTFAPLTLIHLTRFGIILNMLMYNKIWNSILYTSKFALKFLLQNMQKEFRNAGEMRETVYATSM